MAVLAVFGPDHDGYTVYWFCCVTGNAYGRGCHLGL